MATPTKDNAKCPKCGRNPVRLYLVHGKWICGKCGKK